MRGIGINRRIGVGLLSTRGGGGVEPEITAYIDGLTTPLSSGQITLLNTFVKDLKSGLGISALSEAFDQMLILANETAESSLRNLVKRAHDAEAVNSPIFTALEGFTGDGSGAYLDSNYNPATEGVNYTLNDASMGFYSRTDVNDNYDAGTRGTYFSCIAADEGDAFLGLLNSSTSGFIQVYGLDNAQGLFVISRDGALHTDLDGYRNKTKYNDYNGTGGTTGIENLKFTILARRRVASIEKYTARQLSLFFAGGSLTEMQENVLYDTFQAYMTANSKQV